MATPTPVVKEIVIRLNTSMVRMLPSGKTVAYPEGAVIRYGETEARRMIELGQAFELDSFTSEQLIAKK